MKHSNRAREVYDRWLLGKGAVTKKPRWCVIRNVLHWVDKNAIDPGRCTRDNARLAAARMERWFYLNSLPPKLSMTSSISLAKCSRNLSSFSPSAVMTFSEIRDAFS